MKSSLLPRLAAWKSPPRYRTGIVSPCFLTNICPVLVFQERKDIQVWGRLLLAPGCWSSHDGIEATCSQIRSSHISAEECTRKQDGCTNFKVRWVCVQNRFLPYFSLVTWQALYSVFHWLIEREIEIERGIGCLSQREKWISADGYELRIRKQAYVKVVKYYIITTLLWDNSVLFVAL